jgi:hypothetical protein
LLFEDKDLGDTVPGRMGQPENNFYIDKANIGVQPVFDVTDKNNSEFNMNLYVVVPILNSATDTSVPWC